MCLEWLDNCDVKDKTVIDYGCGSGILGIAALLLGAKAVIAIDNDPQALIATLDNARRNNIESSKINVYLPDDAPSNYQADIMLANILAGPLAELAPLLSQLTSDNGQLVLSGIINSQSAALLTVYEAWFEMEAPVLQNEWVRLSGKKKA